MALTENEIETLQEFVNHPWFSICKKIYQEALDIVAYSSVSLNLSKEDDVQKFKRNQIFILVLKRFIELPVESLNGIMQKTQGKYKNDFIDQNQIDEIFDDVLSGFVGKTFDK